MRKIYFVSGLLLILFQLQNLVGLSQVNIPAYTVTNYKQNNSGYYIFALSNKIMIIDNFGIPIYCKQIPTGALDFNIQENGYLYYYTTKSKEFYKIDSSYKIIDTLRIKNGYDLDYHELIVRKNGDAYLYGHKFHVMDLRAVYPGGNQYATVVEDIIQVLDKNKNIKFEWKSLDHISILDCDSTFVDLTSNIIDYVHINSFEVNEQGDIYISARHLNEIIKINGSTGDIIWRLGGKRNEFTMIGNGSMFSGQHSIKILPGGKMLLFDNGNTLHPNYSMGVDYQVNEEAKTIELVRQFRVSPDVFTPVMGSIQQFRDGNVVVGWGKNINGLILTEYDKNNNLVLKIESPESLFCFSITKVDWKTSLFTSNRDSIDFGEVVYGQFSTQKLLITNNSNQEIELSSFSTHDTLFKVIDIQPITIPAKGSTELTIEFNATRFGSFSKDILTINSDGFDYIGDLQRIAIQVKLKGFSSDINAPIVKTYPIDNSINIPVNTSIKVMFDEPVRYIDNTDLSTDKVKEAIKLTKLAVVGEAVLYDVIINSDKNELWLYPLFDLNYNENYYLKIDPLFKDISGNIIEEKQINFTTELSTDINVNSSISQVFTFPNPTSGLIKIYNYGLIEHIDVLGFTGNVIASYKPSWEEYSTINISAQISGLYFIRKTYTDGTVQTDKVYKF